MCTPLTVLRCPQEEQAAAAGTATGAGQGAEEAHPDEQLRRRCGQGHIRAREDCGAAHCEGRHYSAANRAAAPTSAAATAAANAQVDKEIGLTEPPKKQRNVSLSGLLGAKMKKAPQDQKIELDELEEYLADPDVPDTDCDILKWWHISSSGLASPRWWYRRR